MLALQRQGLSQPEHSEDSLFPGPLGVVFNSIEDLRRVSQKITLEEIRDAEEKALLMVRHLSALQTACANFSAIRQFVIKVEQARLHALEDVPKKKFLQPHSPDSDRLRAAAAGAPSPVANKESAAPKPNREANRNTPTASKEDLAAIQGDEFTLGEKHLAEERFDLGLLSARQGAEEKFPAPDKDHYAAIDLAPEETLTAFSFHQDPPSLALPATPKVNVDRVPAAFFDQMINNFTAFVGPMAALIVEEHAARLGEPLSAFPRSRVEELIAQVSREIVDDQARIRFQKQMAEQVRVLASQVPAASQRKEK